MNGFIFGFHRFVWWPKCTPASSNSATKSLAVAIRFKRCPRGRGKRTQKMLHLCGCRNRKFTSGGDMLDRAGEFSALSLYATCVIHTAAGQNASGGSLAHCEAIMKLSCNFLTLAWSSAFLRRSAQPPDIQ